MADFRSIKLNSWAAAEAALANSIEYGASKVKLMAPMTTESKTLRSGLISLHLARPTCRDSRKDLS